MRDDTWRPKDYGERVITLPMTAGCETEINFLRRFISYHEKKILALQLQPQSPYKTWADVENDIRKIKMHEACIQELEQELRKL